jgi:pseudouridine synthase
LIAGSGLASRRGAEELIRDGRVSVNGHVITELGAKADALRDRIVVDGKPLKPPGDPVVLVLHKPKGYVTTKSDPEGRPTVMDLLPRKYQHVHPVGRLDYDTAGVLLLTNDGDITNLLTHPSRGVSKTYWARVKGKVPMAALQKLSRGIELEDGPTAPCQARLKAQTENNSLVEIVLHEGRNRQVRRMLEAIGFPVRALRRVGFANLDVKDLHTGAFRELLPTEVRQLRKMAEAPPEKAKPRKPRGHKPKATQPKTDTSREEKPKAARPTKTNPVAERVRRAWE